jgi:phospholipase/carboxylesterase
MNSQPHLRARPVAVPLPGSTGLQPLRLGGRRHSYLYVPKRCDPAQPQPLVLLLHGAGGHAHDGLDILRHAADDAGLILVAPASGAHSWDAITRRDFVTDLGLVDRALTQVFKHHAVDSSHLAIGGFSDGASYALSLGLANGDLFSHIMAFSPGFIAPIVPRGSPKIFISHGTKDEILPIVPCSRHIVERLRGADYSVTYTEFDGGHTIPPEVREFALEWFLQ